MSESIFERAVRLVSGRQRAYQTTFSTREGKEILADLAKFCRAGKTVFDTDARVTALLQGRQEVFLRIQQHLDLPFNDLYQLLGGPKDDRPDH